MCNLYSITTNQAAIAALFRVVNRHVGDLPPMPGVFPDYPAPPAMTHSQQTIEQPERDCRHHEQVHRGDAISMVTKERPPHPCDGGPLLRTIYLATLVCPTSIPSLRSSPWIFGAPHNGLATLIWRMSWRISTVTVGRPQRRRDFHRQYDLNPKRCQRITVSGRTIASASYILGNSRQTPPNINLSIKANRSSLGLTRRSTLICCLSTRIVRLKRNLRPQQVADHPKDQSTQI